ncbi:MAG: FtsX-like permease family protein [Roseivirga sp.]|nr:FtsX-like permease family protein [Roseivirga sp.]
MLRHFILIFFRNFKRYKSASLINLFGLSVGLASTLLIYLWVDYELNMGDFKEKDSDRHYQILHSYRTSEGFHTKANGTTPNPLSDAMNEEFPEIDYAIPVISKDFHQGVLSLGENSVKAMPQYVGPGYFNVFPANFIEGDKTNVLADKNEVVISEQMAMSLFQSTKAAMGKTVSFKNNKGFDGIHVVTGVFKSSRNNLAQFDLIFSYELFRDRDLMNWYNGGTQVHLVMNPGVDMDSFNEKIKGFLATKINKSKDMLFAQRYSDRYLYDKYENGQAVEGRIGYVRLFSLIAIFVLAIASINYMNFSTAKAARRVKEIGVKKAIGAERKNLVLQHFGESLLMSLLSLAIAIVFVFLLLPKFNEVIDKELMLEVTPDIITGFLAITIITGLLSGIYPAIHLSGFKTVVALKGKMAGGSGALWLRKGLVIFQFSISVILIVSVLVIYKQIEYIQTANLGYEKDHIVTFTKEGKLKKDFEAFLSEVKKVPGVMNASQMKGILPGRIDYSQGFQWKGMDKDEDWKIRFYQIRGGYDLIELLGIKVKEGRVFSRDYPSDKDAMILNQAAIDIIKYENPIGERFFGNRRMHQIIGVVEDFHYQSFREKVGPFVFSLSDNGDHFLVKMQAGTVRETVDRVQELYESFNPGYSFEFKFMDENYQAVYAEEERITVLSRYFAGVAITISCLGLLALTAFSTQRRFKEIAIRKVLGSSGLGIINLLSKEFILLVVLAILVALPVGYYLMQSWLDSFAYRINLTPIYFILAGLLMLIVAWLTVVVQTARSSKVNVSESLRGE